MFWRQNGELPVFGSPLSEPFMDPSEDGQTVLTQYFERAVFELHIPTIRTSIASCSGNLEPKNDENAGGNDASLRVVMEARVVSS